MKWWSASVNLCYRTAYRVAFPPAKLWWRIRRHDGVSVILRVNDRVLLVHHSYKPGLQVPTGGVKPGEDRALAAVRELAEETGVTLDPAELRLVMTRPTPYGQRFVYEARRDTPPPVAVDLREIVYAGFHPPQEVVDPDRHVLRYIAQKA